MTRFRRWGLATTTMVVVLLAGAMTSTSADAGEMVPLTSLDVTRARQGWGLPKVDFSVTGQPLRVAGRDHARGLGTHAPGFLWVELAQGSSRFRASVGVDDAGKGGGGTARFRVVADGGRVLFDSGTMKVGDEPKPVDVDVSGVKHLVLLTGDAGDGSHGDHADWLDAAFDVVGPRPSAIDPPREEAVILTPKPGPAPRINGARAFGVRPGSPFLFTVPATGATPKTYAVEGLPDGLTVDTATGRITGALASKGTHDVTFVVTNRFGSARAPFRIVCGDVLSLTPQMGWNSWYVWENHVTDAIMREAADAMVSTGLIDHGFQYVNIDDCWAIKPGSGDPELDGAPRDAMGRVRTNKRFPDMKALTDHIHAKGLKAGIYTSPGELTCAGFVGALGHEEADAKQFVDWGFDFLKYDWCSYGKVAPKADLAALKKPYALMGEILKKQPRDVVLNLCQYGMGDVWEWGKEVGGQSWRTAGDLGLKFDDIGVALLRDGFDLYARRELHRYGGPGGWNDPDYLLLGDLSNWNGGRAPTPLTPNEQYTHMSLWCLVAAPLFLSGDITRLDEFTLSLLSNDEVIAVDQDALGQPGRRVAKVDDVEVWAKPMADGSVAVGLFNRGEFAAKVEARWSDLGRSGPQDVRDLWRQRELGTFETSFTAEVGRHGVTLIRVRNPGAP
jgi:alpha-galactosidase